MQVHTPNVTAAQRNDVNLSPCELQRSHRDREFDFFKTIGGENSNAASFELSFHAAPPR
jgi:hypothetical protein